LFYEPKLSRDGTISCASCHTQYSGFTHIDHAVSHGINGLKGNRNAPALYNLAWSPYFMWDGGVNHLEVQPLAPITNPTEMDNTLAQIVLILDSLPGYRHLFANAFGDTAITGQRILKALAQFVVTFQSYQSKYDHVMKHEQGYEFSQQENNGLQLFRKHCASCHREPLFTDYSFRNIGLAVDTELKDWGRMKISGLSTDSLKFRVPSLRNIEVSFPYMHDGRFKTIRQVLNHYTHQLPPSPTLDPLVAQPLPLTENDKTDIIAFLLTLTDQAFLHDTALRYPNY
ncbi:MAG: cytochrome-c peroxidase, partial [Chitinophagia bacterium]|nr:cytochrome-c peroxidase [Chitinophagia bacterium]